MIRKAEISAIRYKGKGLAKRVALSLVATLVFRTILDFLYVTYVTQIYSGDFPFIENSVFRLLESYLIVSILSILIAGSLYSRWRPSGIVLVLYFAVVIVPLSSQYALADAPAIFVYAAAMSFGVLLVVNGLLPRVKLPSLGKDFFYFGLSVVLGISLYVYGWLLLTGGLGRLSFDLLSVYEVRAEYVQKLGPLLGYFVPWQANIINIIGLLYALRRRNFWLLGLVAVAQLLLFGMTGHKSFLFAPFLASGIYLVWQRRNAIFWVVIGVTLLVSSSYGYFLITGNEFVPSLFIRRLFFVPARLHVLYYDFFSDPNHPFYLLSDSILRSVLENPYGMPMPHTIALAYWGREFWPDVGYLGDAYGNLGLPGMFLFSVILGFILWIVDSVGARLPSHLVAAAIAMPAMAYTESALFTVLLTHGLVLAILMLWIIQSVEVRKAKRARIAAITAQCVARSGEGR